MGRARVTITFETEHRQAMILDWLASLGMYTAARPDSPLKIDANTLELEVENADGRVHQWPTWDSDTLRERVYGVLTARIAGDEAAERIVLDDLTQTELPAFAGAMLEMVNNVVRVLAGVQGTTPIQTWEAMLEVERRHRMGDDG